MKKQILLPVLLLVLSFFPVHLYSQTNSWMWQNPQPTGNVTFMDFINMTTGYSIGGGSVLKTTNAGENWFSVRPLLPYYLSKADFINENTGWSVGYNNGNEGKILKTTNAGLNWVEQNSGLPVNQPLYAVAFIDANTGIVAGNGGNAVSRTTNGGTNWTPLSGFDVPDWFGCCTFINSSTGFLGSFAIGGSGSIYKTTNAGVNWTKTYTTPAYIGTICFKDDLNGFAGGSAGNMIRTTDGGTTWLTMTVGYGMSSMSFINSTTGWFSAYNEIYKTTDGGSTWNLQSSINGVQFLSSVKAFNTNDVILAGEEGALYKSTNGGTNFSRKNVDALLYGSTKPDVTAIRFANAYTGWVATALATVFKTTNRGLTWFAQNSGLNPTVDQLWDIKVIDTNNVYMCGYGGNILKTTNGGTNWTIINTGIINTLNKLHFFNVNTGFVVGNFGNIRKTTNAGLNWSEVISSTLETINTISFTDVNTGYYAGKNALFGKTTNGGVSWTIINTGVAADAYLADLQFFNNTGWIVGGNGLIRKTTNGGLNWFAQTSGHVNHQYNISMINENTGYVSRMEGYVLKTTNGGTNWISILTGAMNAFYTCHFISENIGWMGGYHSAIVGFGYDNPVTNAGNIGEVIPSTYMLSQNYPNPFNPTTNINYSISSPGVVSVKIYNLLGKEIKEIVNEFNAAGNYSVSFDGSELPSGLYFYKMTVNGFSETRKMILIK